MAIWSELNWWTGESIVIFNVSMSLISVVEIWTAPSSIGKIFSRNGDAYSGECRNRWKDRIESQILYTAKSLGWVNTGPYYEAWSPGAPGLALQEMERATWDVFRRPWPKLLLFLHMTRCLCTMIRDNYWERTGIRTISRPGILLRKRRDWVTNFCVYTSTFFPFLRKRYRP